MSRDIATRRPREIESQPEQDPRRCTADGCSLRGTIDAGGGGRFFCSCHDRSEPEDWSEINAAIREHRWLVDLIGDLHRHINHPRRGQPWHEYAAMFWAGEDGMHPSRDELNNPPAYLLRMHQELLHRVRGAARMQPWIAADVRARNVAAGYRYQGGGAFSGMRSATRRPSPAEQQESA